MITIKKIDGENERHLTEKEKSLCDDRLVLSTDEETIFFEKGEEKLYEEMFREVYPSPLISAWRQASEQDRIEFATELKKYF